VASKARTSSKREIDLLSFLRKHAFPCPQSDAGSDGPFLSQLQQSMRPSLFKVQEGKVLLPER